MTADLRALQEERDAALRGQAALMRQTVRIRVALGVTEGDTYDGAVRMREERDASLQRATEAETLALFGLACLDEARRELGDLDGGWIEDTGRTMGVLTAVEVTERCTADEGACRCEEYGFPTTCVRDSEAVKAYRAARPVPPGEGGQDDR